MQLLLATPHQGATEAYLTWEGGESGATLMDLVKEALMEQEGVKHGYSDLFNYIRKRPVISVRELLPVYDYLYDTGPKSLRSYPNNYPVNYFIDYLSNPANQSALSGINITNILARSGEVDTLDTIQVVPAMASWHAR